MTPRWRSLLFVPADQPGRLAKAHTRGADAVIIDMEDAVAPEAKAAARLRLREAVATLSANGADVVLRVNAESDDALEDVRAAMTPGLAAVIAPKVEGLQALMTLDAALSQAEVAAGLWQGVVGVIALVESPLALERLASFADGPRLIGLALGGEDFSACLGVPPSPQSLGLAVQQIAYAAAARGLMALGIAAPLAEYRNLEAWAEAARQARASGMTGAFCIHPDQVAAVNSAFAPSERELAWARSVIAAWEARGGGVFALDGKMIDKPVADQARGILARA